MSTRSPRSIRLGLALACLAVLAAAPGLPSGPMVGLPPTSAEPAPALAAPGAGIPRPAVLNRYDLTVTYDPEARTIGGTQRLVFTNNTADTLPDLWFHLFPNADHFQRASDGRPYPEPAALRLLAVSVDGVAVTPESEAFHIRLALPRPLAPGASATVELRFVTTIPPFNDRFGYTGGIANITSWYPTLAVYDATGWRRDDYIDFGDPFYSEVAAYRVALSVPAGYVVAATGHLESSARQGAAEVRTYTAENVRDFALAIGRDLTIYEREVADTTIRYYAGPGTGRDAATATLDWAVLCFQTYADLIGPYPYRDLAIVNSDDGMEYPQLVFVGRSASEFTVAHEIAHQWWYGVVGNDEVRELWDEPLTNYTATLPYLRRDGPARYREELQRNALSWRGFTGGARAELCVGCDLYYYRDRARLYGAGVYRKGAAMFAALRELVGDDAFFAFLREFYRRYQFAVAGWSDLIQTASEVTGRDLTGFFHDWLAPGGEPG